MKIDDKKKKQNREQKKEKKNTILEKNWGLSFFPNFQPASNETKTQFFFKKIDKIRIEKIKTWNKHKQKKLKHKNYKKGMETNETRKGKYSKIILKTKNYKKEETK